MSDPEARFRLTATDETAAAFSAANAHLRELERGMRGIRKAADLFGVAFSINAFKEWIKGAVDAKNLTDEQAVSIQHATEAMESFSTASGDLARSFASALAPAIDLVAKGLVGLNHAFFGADANPMEAQVNAARETVQRLRALQAQEWQFSTDAQRAALTEQIKQAEAAFDEIKQKQLGAYGSGGGKTAVDAALAYGQSQLVQMKTAIDELSATYVGQNKGQELTPELTEFIAQLKEGAQLTEKMRTEVEKQVDEWHRAQLLLSQGAIDPEQLTRLRDELLPDDAIKVTAKRLKEVKDDSLDWARDLGHGMKSAFADWLTDSEFNFKDFLRRMAAEFAASALFRGISGAVNSKYGSDSVLGAIFGGFKASGGPVAAGTGYIVGERGPELFVPKTAGNIVPNGAGAPITIEQHLHFDVGLESVDDRIQRAAGPISQATIQAIAKAMRRPSMA